MIDEGLLAWVEEALEPVGRVTMRKMMGGATLYLDGTTFAILTDDQIWLKADAESDFLWDAQGCERFTYTFKNGRVGVMNYRRGPLDIYDDADAMRHWARLAIEAGVRAAAKKKPPIARAVRQPAPARGRPAGSPRSSEGTAE